MVPARIAELVALYVALPALLTLGRLRFHSFPVIPVLWLAMAPIAVWLVRRRGYTPLAVLGIGKAAITERRLACSTASTRTGFSRSCRRTRSSGSS